MNVFEGYGIVGCQGENLTWRTADAARSLPTEIWREHVARRQRCLELREKLATADVHEINDLITLNFDIRPVALGSLLCHLLASSVKRENTSPSEDYSVQTPRSLITIERNLTDQHCLQPSRGPRVFQQVVGREQAGICGSALNESTSTGGPMKRNLREFANGVAACDGRNPRFGGLPRRRVAGYTDGVRSSCL
jgi:hypothetical protein